MIPVPLLTPRLSSLWLALVSPVYAQVGRELIDGVRNATVVQDDRALHDFTVRPRGIREVLARALVNEDLGFAATRWSDALSSQRAPRGWGGVKFGSRRVDSRAAWVACAPDQAFRPDLAHRRATRAGTMAMLSGGCVGCSTSRWVDRGCGGAGGIRSR